MKTMKYKLLLIIACSAGMVMGQNKTETEKFNQEIEFEGSGNDRVLKVRNISGDVSISTYAGTKVMLEYTRTIDAENEQALTRARKISNPIFETRGDSVLIRVLDPCEKCDCDGQDWWNGGDWGNCDPDYRLQFDISIKVPARIDLRASTVNDGDVTITGIEGNVSARNINGSVRITGVTGNVESSTINGDIDVTYDANPTGYNKFKNHNGDITTIFKAGLAADVKFKSRNGDLYTDFATVENMAPSVTQTARKKGTKYELEAMSSLRIGNGGIQLIYETFNGDMYIKHK